MTDDLEDTVLPFWVRDDEPEPPAVYARVYLDHAWRDDRIESAWRGWRALVDQRLVPLFGPEAPAPYIEEEPTAARPLARVERDDPSGAGIIAALGCETHRFADGEQAFLQVYAGLGADRGRLDEVVEAVLDVLRDGAAGVDAGYGELTVGRGSPPRTGLDIALGRSAADSAGAARAALRGYEWATICPAELADRIDPVAGAFTEIAPIAGGGLLLRATQTINGWTQDAARRVFRSLTPVLPDGLPRRTSAARLTRVVFADAAEARAGRVTDLPIGPGPLPPPGPDQVSALTEFVSQAMRHGWLTTEPPDESAPEAIRALFPAEMGMGLTPEGQRQLAELLGLDLPDST